jgi:hypothetical protein
MNYSIGVSPGTHRDIREGGRRRKSSRCPTPRRPGPTGRRRSRPMAADDCSGRAPRGPKFRTRRAQGYTLADKGPWPTLMHGRRWHA